MSKVSPNNSPRTARPRRRSQDLDLVLLVIHLHRQREGRSPDQRWLMQAFGFSSTQPITRRLAALQSEAAIQRTKRRPYNIELTDEGTTKAAGLAESAEMKAAAEQAMARADEPQSVQEDSEQQVAGGD